MDKDIEIIRAEVDKETKNEVVMKVTDFGGTAIYVVQRIRHGAGKFGYPILCRVVNGSVEFLDRNEVREVLHNRMEDFDALGI